MKERLRRFMKAEFVNSSQLAKTLDIQSSGISHILSGRNKPSYDFVTKLLTEFPNLNPDWLLLGKGPMHRDEIRHKTPNSTNQEMTPIASELSSVISSQPSHSSSNLEGTLFDEPLSDDLPITNSTDRKETATVLSPNFAQGKRIERIMILYTDGSFDSYTPTK